MKILIVRFSSIGDIVLTSPVVRCLFQQKKAEITYLTKAAFAAIPAANPMVSRVIALGEQPNVINDKIRYATSFEELSLLLQAGGYDYLIDLHHNLRSFRVKNALNCPAFSFNKLNLKKWLLVNTGINLLPPVHIVQRYMDTVASLGVKYDGQGLDFHLPASTATTTEAIMEAEFPELQKRPFVAFIIGATHATKRLPEPKIIKICQHLSMPVVLLGGPSEVPTGQRIAATAPNVLDTCGRLSLFQSAELVRRAQQVITHDTGLMHIAAAFHKRIISVWGNTVPEFGMYPLYPEGMAFDTRVEVKPLSCRPCSKIGSNHCPKGHFRCMNDISIDAIIGQIQS